MTKLLICSDLHTNFHKDYGKSAINSLDNKDVDIVVVAGDLTTSQLLEANLKQLCSRFPQVVYVAGNHEYYGHTFQDIEDDLSKIESSLDNLTWLNNTRAVVSGVPFIGATLWVKRTVAAQINKHYLNDFRYITDCDPICFDRYEETVDFFEKNIQGGDVVVTHHLPSYQSIGSMYVGSQLNCFFANHLEGLINKTMPSIWIHGHTHIACDYMLGAMTQVCCNPLGYPSEASFFNDSFIIEV